MESNEERKRPFSAISINRITAERFRGFSKNIADSHSATLEDMMDFFEITKISPRNKIMRHYLGFYNYLIFRMDYITDLLREQEKKYHKPIYELLSGLFDKAERMEVKTGPLAERNVIKLTREEWELKEGKVSREKYDLIKMARKKDQEDFTKMLSEIINRIEKVNPTFGKPYHKIEIDFTQLDIMKRRYQNE
tara:strand:- start:326 stop:904 length:579 start_codon:yes stop_codon:yes gene_type:complete